MTARGSSRPPGESSYDVNVYLFFFSSRRRHTRFDCDWSSDVCSSDLPPGTADIFIDSDSVNEVVVQSRGGLLPTFSQGREWRKRHFDLAVIFQNSLDRKSVV